MEKRIKCTECDGTYVKKVLPFNFHGQFIGNYPALICDVCGDTMHEGPVVAEMEKELKKRNLWGLRRKTELVQQTHNS